MMHLMSATPQEPTLEWLQDTCVRLLKNAAANDPPDHQACSKYAELLFKMLPKGTGSKTVLDAEALKAIRDAVREQKP